MRTCPNFLIRFGNMINEGNIPDDMKNIISSLSSNSSNESSNSNSNENSNNQTSNIDFETILKMKSIMEKMNNNNDPRANLLLSLKPYLKDSRKEKVDQYIKLFGMSKVLEVFNNSGGEAKK
ncbi:MAG: hypothetical protein HFJ54_00235 [Clostridia bacterium]|nr:hypothetical protein [Clostridia bacterium]